MVLIRLPSKKMRCSSRWVEHDPLEIWRTVLECLDKALEAARSKVGPVKVVALGITNQRETTLVWDRTTGKPCLSSMRFIHYVAFLTASMRAQDMYAPWPLMS